MPANAIAKDRKIYIGSDNQEWTEAAGLFECGWNAHDDSGSIEIEATLEILPIFNPPESLSPLQNPSRWRPGVPVLVRVMNSSGTFVDHPMGRLTILEEPEEPIEGQGITLILGCKLSAVQYAQKDGDESGVVLGTGQSADAIAARLLEAAGIDSGDISLGSYPHLVASPLPKNGGGSYAAQAGELAYSCSDSSGFRYLYQTPDGTITTGTTDTTIGAPTVTITLGDNDIVYRPYRASPTPAEQVTAAGKGTAISYRDSATTVEQTIGSKSPYSTGSVSCGGIGVIQRTTTKTTQNIPSDETSDITITVTKKLEGVASSVYKNPEQPTSRCTVRQWKRITTVKKYEQNDGVGGRLKSIETEEEQRRFSLIYATTRSERASSLNWETIKRTTETPTYDDDLDGALVKLVVEEKVAEITADENSLDPFRLQVSRRLEKEWKQLGDTEFELTEREELARINFDSSIDVAAGDPWQLVTRTTKTNSTETGDSQPPRTEVFKNAFQKTQQFEDTYVYTHRGGATGRLANDFYEIPYGFSNSQCFAIARLQSKFQVGRHLAYEIELPITDALLTAPPLFQIDVVELDGTIRHFLADAVSWEHAENSASVAAIGIQIGSTPSGGSETPLGGNAVTVNGVTVTRNSDTVYT